MLKLFLAFNLLLLNLLACSGDCDSCKQKVIDSKSIQNKQLQISLPKNQRLIFLDKTPDAKIIKYDPFLNLYLIEDKKPFKYPFKTDIHLTGSDIAMVDKKRAIKGKITKKQVGLNSFASFSKPLFVPSLLLNSCCYFEGIVTSKGIIQKDYIRRFVNSDTLDYADIGIRVKDEKNRVVVKRVDPFVKRNPFKKDDILLKIDGVNVGDASTFMKKILFSKISKSYVIILKRGSKIINCVVKTTKRYGGGYISDSFLEQKGIYFSKDLTIVKLTNTLNSNGLKVGDRLIQLNSKRVYSLDDIANDMSAFKNLPKLLFQRGNFQFFLSKFKLK